MKRFYFILIGFLVFGNVDAQIITFNSTNLKSLLLLVSPDFPIAKDLNGNFFKIDSNNDGEIQVTEALQVSYIDLHVMSDMNDMTGIENFTNLQTLYATNNVSVISLNNLVHLKKFYCSNNQLNSLDLSNLSDLTDLDCSWGHISSLTLTGLIHLKNIDCRANPIFNLDVSNLTSLQTLNCYSCQLNSLNLSGLINLEYLDCGYNHLQNIDLQGLTNLQTLYCNHNQQNGLNLSGLTNLQTLYCTDNQISSLDFIGLNNLQSLYCGNNLIPSLNVNGLINLQFLGCNDNQLSSLDISNLTNLRGLNCSNNQLTALNVNNSILLEELLCYSNQIAGLNISGLPNLNLLNCNDNQLTSLTIMGPTNFLQLLCSTNQLTSLDLSSNNLLRLDCSNNQLTTLNMKNGSNEYNGIDFQNNPNLEYICADDEQLLSVEDHIIFYNYTNCHVNSYCSFTPGGTFYTIQGSNRYDENNNGCSTTDINYPNLHLLFTNGTNSGGLITDMSGSYHYELQAGTQTITPIIENPTYFNVSPTSATVSFPAFSSPYTQDFCITANGNHNDLEVLLIPISLAQPGFDAHYRIIYKNKGTNSQNGTLNLVFDDSVLDYVSSIPNAVFQTVNNLTWNFSNLTPFETRIIDVVLNLNSPMEFPSLNSGDILNYTTNINGLNDEIPADNTSVFNQSIVNSLDPNDKTCIEGNTVSTNVVGNYVHYMIRFENTGTTSAQNIVVKDIINSTKYDISTLIPIISSAPYSTKISNTNQIEFIFKNINLPFVSGSNDGYIVFKVKTKETLAEGDSFSNTANIYFDYNAPIVTNTATTTVANALSSQDYIFSNYITISPNPAKEVLNIENLKNIDVHSISIYNVLGQVVQIVPNAKNIKTIDVNGLKTGNYIIKVISNKGESSCKFIKE